MLFLTVSHNASPTYKTTTKKRQKKRQNYASCVRERGAWHSRRVQTRSRALTGVAAVHKRKRRRTNSCQSSGQLKKRERFSPRRFLLRYSKLSSLETTRKLYTKHVMYSVYSGNTEFNEPSDFRVVSLGTLGKLQTRKPSGSLNSVFPSHVVHNLYLCSAVYIEKIASSDSSRSQQDNFSVLLPE